jgi:hypothetical protein
MTDIYSINLVQTGKISKKVINNSGKKWENVVDCGKFCIIFTV